MAAFLLAFALGCAQPRIPTADVDVGDIRTIALQPVVFRGQEPDIFCPSDIGWELRNQLRARFEKKGFDVTIVPAESRQYTTEPDPLARQNPARIVELSPRGVDAVAILWVDQLDELGFCENERYKHLYLTGTFALISTREENFIWKTTATAGGVPVGGAARSAAIEMARKTIGPLPAVGQQLR